MTLTPEQEARQHIDLALEAAGWVIQDRSEMNLSAGSGIAVREFKMAKGHGFADYMLFVDGKAVGVLEAKPAGYPLTSVELQADKYATGLPDGLNPPVNPLPVVYNAAYPPEFFDVVVIDEVHRSIYSLWRQVVEYFDAFLVGLTATPAKQTFGFFNKNLVMEYDHERAVADGVNVDFEVYNIRTKITERGSTIEAGPGTMLGYRNRRTRALRWETPDEDVTYDPNELDYRVVARDQIRTMVRTFRDRVCTEIFPGCESVPKTLIFAKDDSHAEDIVGIIRDEFGRGNAFCQKITYKVTAANPRDLIQSFRNRFEPRIAVTVDMVSTGTDIKPIEMVMFMRAVKSRVLFEQMKGRGVRVIHANELKAVTPDAAAKTHFVIVDCVGMTDTQLADTHPLERKKTVAFKTLLEHVSMDGTDPAVSPASPGNAAPRSTSGSSRRPVASGCRTPPGPSWTAWIPTARSPRPARPSRSPWTPSPPRNRSSKPPKPCSSEPPNPSPLAWR